MSWSFSSARKMLASFTVISRASSGFRRTRDAIELSVLNRKCGLIWRCRASRRASSSKRFCSSNFISMRSASHTLIAIPTTIGALNHTSTCNQGSEASKAKSRRGNRCVSQSRAPSAATMTNSIKNWRSIARLAKNAAHPAVQAEVDKRRERPDLFWRNEVAQQPGEKPQGND